jgi:hypothetical protein
LGQPLDVQVPRTEKAIPEEPEAMFMHEILDVEFP